MKNLKIFESNICDGPMSGNRSFYDASLSKEEIQKDLLQRRLILGAKHGFYGKRIIVPYQKNAKCPELYANGHYEVITDEVVKGTEDLWSLDIPADIFVLPHTTENVVMAYPVADCPVLIAEDVKNSVTALAHCGAEYIDRELPVDLVKSLQQETNAKIEDIFVYMSSCACSKDYIYDTYPKWATNKRVWNNYIQHEYDGYHINIRGSILSMLNKYNLKGTQFKLNPQDTISNPLLYSNSAAFHGDSTKNGRFLVGCFYQEQENQYTYSKK